MTNNDAALVFSTSTTEGVTLDTITPEKGQRTSKAHMEYMDYMDDPHCFVCKRHTDHWGEHDDMVEAGTARYEEDGSVYPVPWGWD